MQARETLLSNNGKPWVKKYGNEEFGGGTSFSLNVKTNVGKLFFKILRKNFPKTNSLPKILIKIQ